MSVTAESAIVDHLDFLIMQPDQEHAVVRDLVAAVSAFNTYSTGEPLQISFPLFTDSKVTSRGVLGPCVRVTGPAEKLYTLTLRYEISAHLRGGRAMTLVRENQVVDASRNERFALVQAKTKIATAPTKLAGARPLVLSGQSRLLEQADRLGIAVRDEAAFIARAETKIATEGEVDLLGFSEEKTVPVLR
jgi:hypothetical protein